jgi:predicted membrane-bound dolichyl-phosphate-mannose-protein mannosyltransferase
MIAVGLWLRLFRLARPEGSLIFDEAYYVQDARVIVGNPVLLDHLPAHALSGLDPNSEHPPLAKLVMAAAMYLFPHQAAAWRLPSVALGVLSIWLIYRIARAIGGSTNEARLAAFVMTFDNLAFVHGRIATLDIYLVTFMLLGAWLYLERYVELAAIAFGLATLCKLNGVFGVVAIALFEGAALLRAKDRPVLAALRAVATLSAVFVAFTLLAWGALDCGWTVYRNPIEHLEHVLKYGASLKQTGDPQGAASTPVQWWLNQGSINYLQVQASANGITRTTVLFRGAMCEYIVFAAPLALAWMAREAWRGTRAGALVIALLVANYGPVFFAWLLASRTSYIYYMLPTLPAIALAIAFALRGAPRFVSWAFVGAVLFSFGVWFPFRWY